MLLLVWEMALLLLLVWEMAFSCICDVFLDSDFDLFAIAFEPKQAI